MSTPMIWIRERRGLGWVGGDLETPAGRIEILLMKACEQQSIELFRGCGEDVH